MADKKPLWGDDFEKVNRPAEALARSEKRKLNPEDREDLRKNNTNEAKIGMKYKKALDETELSFCIAYVTGGTKTFGNTKNSAIAAGHSEDTAAARGHQHLKKQRVKDYIKELHEQILDEAGVNKASVLANIANDRTLAREEGQFSVAMRGNELEAKTLNMFDDKTSSSVELERTLTALASMTTEELKFRQAWETERCRLEACTQPNIVKIPKQA